DPDTTAIYTPSLHDALPIFGDVDRVAVTVRHQHVAIGDAAVHGAVHRAHLERGDLSVHGVAHLALEPRMGRVEVAVEERPGQGRSEEHTSELQSRGHLVCRL